MQRLARLAVATMLWMILIANGSVAQTPERDVPYGTDPKQRLDLSLPYGKGFPTVLFVHGAA